MNNNSNHLNGNNTSKQQTLEFPVTYTLKVVFLTEGGDTDSQQSRTEAVLSNQSVPFRFKGQKESSKGNYISYSFEVTLLSREQMDQMYIALKGLKGFKTAI